MASSERFGYEWDTYRSIEPYKEHYRMQFLRWMHPLTPEFFENKEILDAGCGMGRNSYFCMEYGAKRLVAFDLDDRTVRAARQTLSQFSNAQVVKMDIYALPWRDEFDFAFSIGVIHHLKDPLAAIASIKRTLKPGGTLLIWVYGREGFETMLKVLDPLRIHITSKLPLRVLHALTYVASVPVYAFVKMTHHRNEYLEQLRSFTFAHIHSIIFDQLLPSIARYYTHDQARDLLQGFKDIQICQPPNKNGWIVRGVK